MNPRDLALQTVTPTVMVPKFEPLQPLAVSGHRFLAATDGLWLEVRRAWLHAVVPVCLQNGVPMPYGVVEPKVDLKCGKVPKQFMTDFLEMARGGMPNEVAAAVLWNEATGAMRLVAMEAESASAAHIRYRSPSLGEGEHLVMDIHSHGSSGAYFSSQDNQDDATAVRLAAVFGNVDKPEPSYTARLCVLGQFLSL